MHTYILFIVGINILQIQNAKSFVMLSANIGDIKRLALKVLPPSIVNDVADALEDLVMSAKKSSSEDGEEERLKTIKHNPVDTISVENLKYQNGNRIKDFTGQSKNTNASKKLKRYKMKNLNKPDNMNGKKLYTFIRNAMKKSLKEQSKPNVPIANRNANNVAKVTNFEVHKSGRGQRETFYIQDSDFEEIKLTRSLARPTPKNPPDYLKNTSDSSEDNEANLINTIQFSSQDSSKEVLTKRNKKPSQPQETLHQLEQSAFINNMGIRRGALTTAAKEKNEFDQYFNYLPRFDYARI